MANESVRDDLIYLETGSTDPYYNLAFEEYILTERRQGNYLILWQNDNTIVVGLNQNTESEINRAFVEENAIHVVRRTTGGGAVYHDLGNLNYSFITDVNDSENITKKRFTDPIIAALRSLGLDAETSGRNDILINGRKVSGTAQRIDHGRILHHGTLLFDSNPSLVEGALRVDPEKYKAKGIKSVRSRIGNIRPLLREDMSMQEFRDYLKKYLLRENMSEPSALTAEDSHQTALSCLTDTDRNAIQKLRNEKYATWEWNFGRSAAFTMHNKKRFPLGTCEIYAEVSKGYLSSIRFYGDFLALSDMTPLLQHLIGVPFRKENVSEVLDQFPLPEYFGGITKEEILSLLFT